MPCTFANFKGVEKRKKAKRQEKETEEKTERKREKWKRAWNFRLGSCSLYEQWKFRSAKRWKMQQQRDRSFLNFVFAVATVHGCHYVSANSHVVVNHLWLLCIACKAKEAAARIPRLFLDPRWWCPVAAGYVCNFETKGELEGRERERGRDREFERADEQVPLDFNRFTRLLSPSFFYSSFLLSLLLLSFSFLFFPFSLHDLINLFEPEDLFSD